MEDAVQPPPANLPNAPRRRGLLWIGVVIVALAAYALWWFTLGAGGAAVDDLQALRTQVETLNHDVARLRNSTDVLRARLDDGDKVDKSVREQLLALSERARLAEDAVASLADKRLSGHDALVLDEAELLLTLGGERYALFHDAAGAIAAYRRADVALSEIEDATFAVVRQGVAAEIAAFEEQRSADAAALSARLARLRAQAGQWPVRTQGLQPAPAAQAESRLARALATFVQVRHDDAPAAVALHAPDLARELLLLELHAAEAAALARDEASFRSALAAARVELGAAFDAQTPTVAAAAAELDGLAGSALAPAPPALFGAALKELRNLRATHALRESKVMPLRPNGESK